MRFYTAVGVPKKSGVARLFDLFATAVIANFQDFYADDERSERRYGESDTPDADTVNALRRNAETVNAIRRNAETVKAIRRTPTR